MNKPLRTIELIYMNIQQLSILIFETVLHMDDQELERDLGDQVIFRQNS